MRKYFIASISYLYAFIIFINIITGKIGNYLAPQMQKYAIFALIMLIICGSVVIFSKTSKLKKTDLLLILPLIMLMLSNGGELSTSIAGNRTNNFNFEIKENETTNELEETEIIYDFTNVDFAFEDEAYEQLGNYLTYSENATKHIGKKVRIRGFVLKDDNIPNGYFGFGKYAISCCAADATFTGLFAKSEENITKDAWYEIEGILEKSNFENISLVLKVINIKPIDKDTEEYYVYPCYAYDDGLCEVVRNYNLD